jgi:hypothetical protein
VGLSAIVFTQHARARSGDDLANLQTEELREQVRLLRSAVEELNVHAMSACNSDTSHPDPLIEDDLFKTWHRLLTTGPLSQIVPPMSVHDPLLDSGAVVQGAH